MYYFRKPLAHVKLGSEGANNPAFPSCGLEDYKETGAFFLKGRKGICIATVKMPP
jgi:hypothetical protein